MRILISLFVLALLSLPTLASADDDRSFFSFRISTWDGGGSYDTRPSVYRDHDHHERHRYDRHRANTREYQKKIVYKKRGYSHRHKHERFVWTPPSRVFYKRPHFARHQPCNSNKRGHRSYRW